MRTTFLGAVLVLPILSSAPSFAQDKKSEPLEGNGKVVTRDITVSSFDELKASGVYELKLVQGSKESVKIEADENLQDLFQVRNDGNRLVIEMKKDKDNNISLKKSSKLKVYVTFTKLKALQVSTVGSVNADDQLSFDNLQLKSNSVGNVNLKLTANQVDITNNGVGNVTLSGKAQQAVVKNSGVGSIEAGSFVVQTMNIENTGVGHANVNAEKELKIKDSFLGKVKNKGNATVRRMNKVRV